MSVTLTTMIKVLLAWLPTPPSKVDGADALGALGFLVGCEQRRESDFAADNGLYKRNQIFIIEIGDERFMTFK